MTPSPLFARAEDLPGVWRLVCVVTTLASGETLDISYFGARPEGLIVYDRSGWMSVQIQRDPKPAVPGDVAAGRRSISDAEAAAELKMFSAYCGTWTFDDREQSVSHLIEWATYPRKRGDVLKRFVAIERDTVTLSTEPLPDGARNHLTWQRIA